jgi:hypothetical protein
MVTVLNFEMWGEGIVITTFKFHFGEKNLANDTREDEFCKLWNVSVFSTRKF